MTADTINYEAMVQGQRAKRDQTREKILAALQIIEDEISERGLYPHNHGKINLLEVQRRAGVGSTTLRNAHHHDVRGLVQDWLAQLKSRGAPTSKPAARAVTREKVAWYEEQLKLLSARIDLADPKGGSDARKSGAQKEDLELLNGARKDH